MIERRAAAAADEPFLRELYASTRPDLAGLGEALAAPLLDMQFRAQQVGWESSFPGFEHELILVEGRPAGRIWVAWASDECRIVDFALLPEFRRRGIARQVIGELVDEADRRGVPVRATVERVNGPSLAMQLALGFEVVGEDAVNFALERPVSEACRTPSSA